MVAAGRNEVRTIGAEGTIPDPSLMPRQRTLEFKRLVLGRGFARVRHERIEVLDFPDLGCVVGGAGCEVLDVGGEEDARDVFFVGAELSDGDEGGLFAVLHEVPDVDIALLCISLAMPDIKNVQNGKRTMAYSIGASAQGRSIACHRDARNRNILFGNQLMRACILSQVPNPDTASAVAADDLALVGMDDYIVDRTTVVIAPLDAAAASLPDLDVAILGTSDHPFAFAVKCDTCYVARMAFEREDGIGIRGLDVVELDRMVARSSEEALIWRNAEAIDLGIRVLNCPRADAREGLPES